MSAADAAALQQSDAKAFEAHFLSKTFATVRIKARARSETYQEQSRVKHRYFYFYFWKKNLY